MKRKFIICTIAMATLLMSGCTQENAQNNNSTGTMLSEKEAQDIALTHAGFTTDEVTFTKSEIDRDNGQEYYDVEFYTKDGMEYDYEIDGYNGNILEWDAEKETR